MIVTEKEAYTKACMFVRAQLYAPDVAVNPAVNRCSADFNCRASECMHWEFVDPVWEDPKTGHHHSKRLADTDIEVTPRGYCSLGVER